MKDIFGEVIHLSFYPGGLQRSLLRQVISGIRDVYGLALMPDRQEKVFVLFL